MKLIDKYIKLRNALKIEKRITEKLIEMLEKQDKTIVEQQKEIRNAHFLVWVLGIFFLLIYLYSILSIIFSIINTQFADSQIFNS